MAIIGIDLGTTNSLACVCQDGKAVLIPNSLGKNLTPSVVSIDENGEICVGAVAKERLISHPEATAASFKRYMGTNKAFTLSGKDFTPQDLSSFVLRQLKEDAERLAGIHVERLVNEPSSAALTASRLSGEEEGSYLVFDFGGGTLDVSVVDYFDNVIEIVAVSGDNRLGGDDFDEVIARSFCAHHQMDYDGMDRQKRAALLAVCILIPVTIHRQRENGRLFLIDYMAENYPETFFSEPERIDKEEDGSIVYALHASAHPELSVTAKVENGYVEGERVYLVKENYGQLLFEYYAAQYGWTAVW